MLSSFLDNAPTYLTFMALALGQLGIETAQVTAALTGVCQAPPRRSSRCCSRRCRAGR